MTSSAMWVQNSRGIGGGRSSRHLAAESYEWKEGRFWRQKRSFSASISQVFIFYA